MSSLDGQLLASTCLKQTSSWSTEHRQLEATACSLDWSGTWVLLAGRRHLALQSLERNENDEEVSLQKFHRNSKYEVSAAEWAICQSSQDYCAIAVSRLRVTAIEGKSFNPVFRLPHRQVN